MLPIGDNNTEPVVKMETIINALRRQIECDNKFWQKLLEGLNSVKGDDKVFFCFLLAYIGHNKTAKKLRDSLQSLDGLLSRNKELEKELEAFINDRQGKRFDFHHGFLQTKYCRPGFVKGILDFRDFVVEVKEEYGSLKAYLDAFDTFDGLFNSLYKRKIKYMDKALHVFDFMETLYRTGTFLKKPERMYLKERLSDSTGLGPIRNGLSSFYIGKKLENKKKAIKRAYAEHYGISEENVPEKVKQLGIDLQERTFGFFKDYDKGKLVFVLETLLCVYDPCSSNP